MRPAEEGSASIVAVVAVRANDRLLGEVVAAALDDLVAAEEPTALVVTSGTSLPPIVADVVVDLTDATGSVWVRPGQRSVIGCEPVPVRVSTLHQLAGLVAGNDRHLEQHRLYVRSRRGELQRLTNRELEVLEHLRRGASNHAIAERLDISTHTVRSHVNNIMRKLGASRRTEAIAGLG